MSKPFYNVDHPIEDEYGDTLIVTPYSPQDLDHGPEIALNAVERGEGNALIVLGFEAATELRDILIRFIEGNPPQ